MKYCPDCGCENIDEAQFCRNCGLKFDVEDKNDIVEVNNAPQETVVNTTPQKTAVNDDSIISQLFFKTDKYTGELRFAKAKSFSIGVFVLMFIFAMSVGAEGASFFVVLLAAIIFALVFAVPTYVIGYIIGLLVDRISN